MFVPLLNVQRIQIPCKGSESSQESFLCFHKECLLLENHRTACSSWTS